MKAFIRYSPLLLLAVAWEVIARLELVSSSALPPLSSVIAAWIDLIHSGELLTNGVLALPRRDRASAVDRVGTRSA
jgi:NitT/TauT family transport system permease protein